MAESARPADARQALQDGKAAGMNRPGMSGELRGRVAGLGEGGVLTVVGGLEVDRWDVWAAPCFPDSCYGVDYAAICRLRYSS